MPPTRHYTALVVQKALRAALADVALTRRRNHKQRQALTVSSARARFLGFLRWSRHEVVRRRFRLQHGGFALMFASLHRDIMQSDHRLPSDLLWVVLRFMPLSPDNYDLDFLLLHGRSRGLVA